MSAVKVQKPLASMEQLAKLLPGSDSEWRVRSKTVRRAVRYFADQPEKESVLAYFGIMYPEAKIEIFKDTLGYRLKCYVMG